jgi:peptidoglycan/LPS O-acetylase OafA/YrhL
MIINVQFLRFVAAFLVVLYHARTHVNMAGAELGPIFTIGEAVGFAGVDVFFVISGFIMFHTTKNRQGPADSWLFVRRRLARIYSGYWPFFVAAVLIFWWARPARYQGADLLSSFLLLPVPMNLLILDVSWTLTYELYFYFLFTFLVLVGALWRWRILVAALVVLLGYNLVRHFAWQDFSAERLYTHSFANLFYLSPFLLQFFAGAVLARFTDKGTAGWGWLLLLAGVAGFAAAGVTNHAVYDGTIESGYHYVPRVLIFGIPSCLVLLGLIWLERANVVAPAKFSLLAGGASYAIYLSHTLIQTATMKLGLNSALSGLPDWAVQGLFLLHSALIVWFSIAWYVRAERPLNGWFKRLLRVHSERPSPAGGR